MRVRANARDLTASSDALAALAALAADDLGGARVAAARASAGGSPLGHELVVHLDGTGTGVESVYAQPDAFEAFIRGGGNVALYAATGAALAAEYRTHEVDRLLDIGCGDGLAAGAAMREAVPAPSSVDLVEPSPVLLNQAADVLGPLARLGVRSRATTAQEFVAGLDAEDRWDLVQSTFALHAIEPVARSEVLVALRPHTAAIAVVEFDVPALDIGSDEYFASLVERYERGIVEYGNDRSLVAQGFLMPVLVGQLLPGAGRTTWEQPASAWEQQLRDAGFGSVERRPVADYWWAPAVILLGT